MLYSEVSECDLESKVGVRGGDVNEREREWAGETKRNGGRWEG